MPVRAMEQDLGQGSVQDWAQQRAPGQETAPRLAQEPDLEREMVPYWAPEQGLSSVPVPVSWLVQARA